MGREIHPAILVSFAYYKTFKTNRPRYVFRDWVMDSGAFSMKQSGKEVNLNDYISLCRNLSETDPLLREVYSLDVIGDWKAGLRNTEKMWEDGVNAIPTFHAGEPWHVLKHMAKHYPKVAIGGLFGLSQPQKYEWFGQVFARVWPKPLHCFGTGTRKLVLGFPWHSVDVSSWERGPRSFGTWRRYGPLKGVKVKDLQGEVDYYLEIEHEARGRYGKVLANEGFGTFDLRLAVVTDQLGMNSGGLR